jgi:hypothetical protein
MPTPVYALNLFDLADNDDYRSYSRRSVESGTEHYLWWAFEQLTDLRSLFARDP